MVAVELAKDEQDLIKAVGIDDYFVFDINNSKKRKIELWVDFYQKGVLKQKNLGLGLKIDNNIRIIFAASKITDGDKCKERWTVSTLDESGVCTGSAVVLSPEYKAAMPCIVEEQDLVESESLPLAAIIRTNDTGLSGYDLRDEESLQELLANDYVYLLQMSVTAADGQ